MFASIITVVTTILIFIILLSVLVLIHELGHFIMARIFGIKVEEFGFGFPPRAIGWKKGETIYSINWLPIGGFVKLYGEDETGGGKIVVSHKSQVASQNSNDQRPTTNDLDRAFFSKPTWQRALVVVAGVVMNFLLAVAIYSFIATVNGIATPDNTVVVTAVEKNTPAATSGLQSGDIVQQIDEQKITTPAQLVAYTKKHVGQQLTMQVKTAKGQEETLMITPRAHPPKGEGAMGVGVAQNEKLVKTPWYRSVVPGFNESIMALKLTYGGLVMLVSQLFQGQIPQGAAGPIGIARVTGQVEQQYGPIAVVGLAGAISINLALLNILPIPALDGGRFFFIIVDGIMYAVSKRRLSPKVEGYLNPIFFALLIGLILLFSFHDIVVWISGKPLLPQ